MLPPRRRRRKPLRLIQVPLPEFHPDWLELDRELPQGHLARRIRSLVEQIDLAGLFDSFTGVGSPAHPPDLLLQLVLFELQRKQLSPARWFCDSRESLPARWLLRGLRPARCVLYRFRKHLPPELVDELNRQVLRWAQDEGHTPAAHGALDGTFPAAAGSRHRLLNSEALQRRCEQLDAALAAGQGAGAVAPGATGESAAGHAGATGSPGAGGAGAGLGAVAAHAHAPTQPTPSSTPPAEPMPAGGAVAVPAARPGWMARSHQGRQRQRCRYAPARQTLRARLDEHAKKQKRQRKAKRRSAAQVKICPSEPEAVLGKDKMKVFRPLYNTQIVQDLDSAFVLGYGVYASVTDAGLLPPMLQRTAELTGRELKELLTDGIYARLLDVRDCREREVRLYAPVATSSTPDLSKGKDNGAHPAGAIGKEQFEWLAQEHTYRCPQGHRLSLERCCAEERRDGEQVMVEQFRCAAEHCRTCPLASRCTKRPDKGRTIKRMQGQELLDEVGARMATPEGKQRYKRRSQTVELCHADFRAHRGLDRFRSFGLRAGQSLIGLLVLAHNGLALLDARDAKKVSNQESPSPP
jgi:Transposase DDE domain